MKDYLIKFNDDGRRGTTYADGVHYFVMPDGSVMDGSIKVQDLLDQGFVWVETKDYLNLLGNNTDKKEYCRQSDGSFSPYVAPDPTEEEQAEAQKAELKAEYEAGKAELLESLQAAQLTGNTDAVASIQAEYKEFAEAYKQAVEEVG